MAVVSDDHADETLNVSNLDGGARAAARTRAGDRLGHRHDACMDRTDRATLARGPFWLSSSSIRLAATPDAIGRRDAVNRSRRRRGCDIESPRPGGRDAERDPRSASTRWIKPDEVREHKSKESFWAVVDGFVVDATEFVRSHPGGLRKLLQTDDPDVGATGEEFGFSFSRGRNARSPRGRQVAATPRPIPWRNVVGTPRGDAAAATWIFRGDRCTPQAHFPHTGKTFASGVKRYLRDPSCREVAFGGSKIIIVGRLLL